MSYEITPNSLVNFPRPAISGRWQEEFAKIVGKNDYGKPQIRLVWGPDEHRIAYGKLRKKYLAAVLRKMVCWEERSPKGTIRKHPTSSTPPDTIPIDSIVYPVYESTDIGKPRWYLEEWWAPELVMPDWENQRYEWQEGVRVDILGPAPVEGMYRFFKCIQAEDGSYREPNDSDLEDVKSLLRQRDQEKKQFSTRELQDDKEAIKKLAGQYTEIITSKEDKQGQEFEETIKEAIRPHLDKLVDNPEAIW